MTGPLRSDARQNRARIIAAARGLVTTREDLTLREVARQAGVGQGTLYRHFPTREALLSEVYRSEVDDLVSAAPELLAAHAPLEALRLWFERIRQYAEVKRDVFAAVETQTGDELAGHSLGPIGEAVSLLLTAGQREGAIRGDVDAREVVVLISFLTRLDPAEYQQRAGHMLTIVLDGLRRQGA